MYQFSNLKRKQGQTFVFKMLKLHKIRTKKKHKFWDQVVMIRIWCQQFLKKWRSVRP